MPADPTMGGLVMSKPYRGYDPSENEDLLEWCDTDGRAFVDWIHELVKSGEVDSHLEPVSEGADFVVNEVWSLCKSGFHNLADGVPVSKGDDE